ncbi:MULTISPECIES: phycobilisome protein [Arthrospira]|jgi:hypothetical protein|uniref:Phycobilisome protein n=1 Tax=Limnospira platensis NIES-46 TaxID=1236695 RepID=A0A5M3TBG4_LIMPL|nr:phycobilisome protein [Arthrospira platensis]AMW28297.1 phycobilisome protein [Arthrospira platensis YZ]KDR55712.1 phycobilisome protein [Arthrospira platensis str. Paraca]MBD2671180.1 phycobilisome protein [Arthrospira platensis FACHB-439]MBD2710275.1 phycobilisome protein [Arthrospira platensis FACHB-835]MDF2209459.1 phycobilisome protein [Arthrospira platensis NCB002]MDT9184669.1 phycobilisome protein [Limnospira sp. PMC 289.06]MDT9296851.1 phycobilisome protein [Arthrospira platensis 
MSSDVNSLLTQAENRYLKPEELQEFKRHTSTLAQRLKIYEFLRDREAVIFEPIVEKLQTAFPEAQQPLVEKSLQHWILIMRHCAMAMLLDDTDYLKNNVLDWLRGFVKTRQSQTIETKIHELLLARLQEMLSPKAMIYLEDNLNLAKDTLLANSD